MWFPLAPYVLVLAYGPWLCVSDRLFASTKQGNSINQLPVNANNGGFWIGKPTKSRPCPAGSPPSQCPEEIVTAIDLTDRMYNVGTTQRSKFACRPSCPWNFPDGEGGGRHMILRHHHTSVSFLT